QQRQRFRSVPGVVAHFDDEWVIAKAQKHRGKIRHGFLGAMKGKRELQQHRAEFSGGAQDIKAGADGALVLGRGSGNSGSNIVRETLPKFCSEKETRVAGDKINPLLGIFRFQRLVKRSIDFDGVEEVGEVRSFVKTAW